MRALTELAGQRRFLLVGDSKLVSYGNLAALIDAKVEFLAPAPKAVVPAAVLAGLDWASAAIVGYVADRDQHKFAHQRVAYRAREGATTLRGPRRSDPLLTVRTVYIWSSARAHAAQAARVSKLDRAHDDLDRLTRAAGSHHLYRDADAVGARVAAIAAKRRVTDHLVWEVVTDPDTAKPALIWHFDQAVLDAEAATDGW
jgi:hypothetical protein